MQQTTCCHFNFCFLSAAACLLESRHTKPNDADDMLYSMHKSQPLILCSHGTVPLCFSQIAICAIIFFLYQISLHFIVHIKRKQNAIVVTLTQAPASLGFVGATCRCLAWPGQPSFCRNWTWSASKDRPFFRAGYWSYLASLIYRNFHFPFSANMQTKNNLNLGKQHMQGK